MYVCQYDYPMTFHLSELLSIEIVLYVGFCLFSFSDFTFGFHGFHLKQLTKILHDTFELARGRKFSGEQ